MASRYPVPAGEAQVELRFKNSRFIGVAAPVATVAEARDFVQEMRRVFPDASHHVYGFAVGYGATVTHGMSDDREPSGTAGRPVLAVVQGAGLGDVVVVVIRYFGGTKLGTGGLVRAYTETAQAVLAAVSRQDKVHTVVARLELPYEFYNQVKVLINNCGGEIQDEDFGAGVEMHLRIDEERFDELRRVVRDATSGRVEVEQIL